MSWEFELYKEIGRPTVEVIRELLVDNSVSAVARIVGVHHRTIKNYAVARGIPFTFKLMPKEMAPRAKKRPDTRTRFIELDGKKQTITEWAKELGVTRCKISKRLDRGLSVREALQPGSTRHKFPANNVKGKARG